MHVQISGSVGNGSNYQERDCGIGVGGGKMTALNQATGRIGLQER